MQETFCSPWRLRILCSCCHWALCVHRCCGPCCTLEADQLNCGLYCILVKKSVLKYSIPSTKLQMQKHVGMYTVKSYNVKYFLYHTQQIAVLGVVYFTAMGFILHFTGIEIYLHYNAAPLPYQLDNNISVMFSGSFLACLFWVNCNNYVVFSLQRSSLQSRATSITTF